jgi:hypothetical protein
MGVLERVRTVGRRKYHAMGVSDHDLLKDPVPGMLGLCGIPA